MQFLEISKNINCFACIFNDNKVGTCYAGVSVRIQIATANAIGRD
jgi:hypothetical protein